VVKKLVDKLWEFRVDYDTSALGISFDDLLIEISDQICRGRRFDHQVIVVEVHGDVFAGRGSDGTSFEE